MAHYRFLEPAYIDGKYYSAGIHEFDKKRKFEEDYIKPCEKPTDKNPSIFIGETEIVDGIVRQKGEVAKKLAERKKAQGSTAEAEMAPLA